MTRKLARLLPGMRKLSTGYLAQTAASISRLYTGGQMMSTKTDWPSRVEIVRAARAIHDNWSMRERVHRREVAIFRQRELLAKMVSTVAVSSR
jgi:hypothetical protein